MILLSAEAARSLGDALTTALASPEASSLASWPRELCAFPVSPQFKGREQYVSFHLDSGSKPFSLGHMRWIQARDALGFLMAVVGVICSIRWLVGLFPGLGF